AASTVSVRPLAACDTASRALVLTWSAGHWPAAADDRPAASEPITTPAKTVVRPMVRPLMMRSNMFLSPLLTAWPDWRPHPCEGSAGERHNGNARSLLSR